MNIDNIIKMPSVKKKLNTSEYNIDWSSLKWSNEKRCK